MSTMSRKCCQPPFLWSARKTTYGRHMVESSWRRMAQIARLQFLHLQFAFCIYSQNGPVDGCAPGVHHTRLLQEQRLHQCRPEAVQKAVQHLPNTAHECDQVVAAHLRGHRLLAGWRRHTLIPSTNLLHHLQ